MSTPNTQNAGHRWAGNVWLLTMVGLAAIIGGYWLPSRLSSGETNEELPSAGFPASAQKEDAGMAEARSNQSAVGQGSGHARRLGNASGSQSAWPEAPEIYAPLSRLAWATAAVVGLLLLGVVFLRRFWLNRYLRRDESAALQLTAELPLSSRCRLVLVRAGREQILVGMDSSGLKAMATLPSRFSDWLDDSQPVVRETSTRPSNSAILAAMVGEGEQGDDRT